MVVAVAKALEEGGDTIVCASTGNTSASAAAYGARCGLSTVIVVPSKYVARGKLAQAITYGAELCSSTVASTTLYGSCANSPRNTPSCSLIPVNPYRLEGQKTAAFEIIEDLGGAPTTFSSP